MIRIHDTNHDTNHDTKKGRQLLATFFSIISACSQYKRLMQEVCTMSITDVKMKKAKRGG